MDGRSNQVHYWRFFWPLSLTGLAIVMARQLQNGAVGRFENATEQLATVAYGWSMFHLFNAMLAFLPQTVNVYARTRRSRRLCLWFTLAVGAVLTLPVATLAFTPVGPPVIGTAFDVSDSALGAIVGYLRLVTPLVLIAALRQYAFGLLIQGRRTGLVTSLHVTALMTQLVLLIAGFYVGWTAVNTVAIAQVLSGFTSASLGLLLVRRVRRSPVADGGVETSWPAVLGFYWPVAITGMMFSLSRPVIYSFAGRVAEGVAVVAALKVASDLTMVFQASVNQSRHLFVTFGRSHLHDLGRFMIKVWAGVTVLMLLVVATPLSEVVFRDALGLEPRVVPLARETAGVLCLLPLMVTVRNWFHGLAMTGKSTLSMAAGAASRTALVYLLGWSLYHAGVLNHVTGAVILVTGFLVEIVAAVTTLRLQGRLHTAVGPEDVEGC
ncbi:MAG: hypothetical protein ACOC95_01840 [Planctomycetota bacterium]